MSKAVLAAAAAVSIVGAASPALADPTEWGGAAYADLGYSFQKVQGASPGSVTARFGYHGWRYLGVEGELGYGITDGSRAFGVGTPLQTQVSIKPKDSEAVYLVGYFPFADKGDLFARVGYGRSAYRIEPVGASNYSAHETGLRWGFGGEYFLDVHNGVRLEWTRYEFNSLHDPGGYFSAADRGSQWTLSYAHRF